MSESSSARRVHVFGSLCALVFFVNFGRVAFAPLYGPFIAEFGVNRATVGVTASLVWLGSALPRIPTGYLLTRVARHRVVLATGAFLTGASAFTALAATIEMVFVGGFLIGVSSGAYFIAANPLISELFPERVGRVIGVHGTAMQLAAVGAPVTVGALLGVTDWRTVFWLLAAVAAVTTVAVFLTTRRADLPEAGSADRNLVRAVRRQWRLVLTGIAILGVTTLVWNGFWNFYTLYAVEAKGLTSGTANLLLTGMFAAGVPAFWFAGRLADRVAYVPLLIGVLAGFAACLFALTYATGLLAVTVATLATGAVVHCLFPTIDTFLLDSLPDADRSSAYSAYSAGMMTMQAAGGTVVGVLSTGLPYDLVFRALAVALGALVVVLVLAYRADLLPEGAAETPT
ncbi:MFS transporter [Salarchaeum sp. III]|uniref:MFS transporter n=1 Tax=Salarchaeum sp. III TaxID=3107927 RepID=UPI002EDA4C46